MTETASDRCADAETLAAFVEGTLTPQRRAEVIRHISRCARCRSVVESAVDGGDERQVWSFARRVGLAVAAGLTIVLAGYLFVRAYETWRVGRLDRLASAMPSSARTIEPRLSHFRWAPLYRLRRDGDGRKSPEELKIGGTAGAALRQIGKDRSPDALHTAGVAYVLTNDTPQGIAKLREAAAGAPGDATVWSDLSAALYCEATAHDDKAAFREALAADDRAIQLDPRLPEPYFNRALIVERIGTPTEAVAAWQAFLAVDGRTGWATEAREHLRDATRNRRP